MFRYSGRGFTLIELLVVIAIIGILSSVVLASLNTARTRGRDAAIRSQMMQIRSQAAIFYSTYGSYTNTGTGGSNDQVVECTNPSNASFTKFIGTVLDPGTPGNINTLLISASDQRNTSGGIRIFCSVYPESWAFAIPLHNPSSGMNGWCVDSQGEVKEVSLNFGSTGAPLVSGGAARCP